MMNSSRRQTRSLATILAAADSSFTQVAAPTLSSAQLNDLMQFPVLGSSGRAPEINTAWVKPRGNIQDDCDSDDDCPQFLEPPPLMRMTHRIAQPVLKGTSNSPTYVRPLKDPRWSRARTPVCETNPGVWSESLKRKDYKLSKRRMAWMAEHGYDRKFGEEDEEARAQAELEESETAGPMGKTQWGGVATESMQDNRTRLKKNVEKSNSLTSPQGKFEFWTA